MSRLHVLMLEGREDQAFVAKQCLLRSHPEIELAVVHSADAALQHLKHTDTRPDLILVDADTDWQAAFRFIESLKSIQGAVPTPVLLLAENIDEEHLRQAYRAGAAGYIPRPLNLPVNLRRLQNYLDMLQVPLTVWPYGHIPSVDIGVSVA